VSIDFGAGASVLIPFVPILSPGVANANLGRRTRKMVFRVHTTNPVATYSWTLPGSDLVDRSVALPSVSFGTPGTYTGSVVVTDALGNGVPYSFQYTVTEGDVEEAVLPPNWVTPDMLDALSRYVYSISAYYAGLPGGAPPKPVMITHSTCGLRDFAIPDNKRGIYDTAGCLQTFDTPRYKTPIEFRLNPDGSSSPDNPLNLLDVHGYDDYPFLSADNTLLLTEIDAQLVQENWPIGDRPLQRLIRLSQLPIPRSDLVRTQWRYEMFVKGRVLLGQASDPNSILHNPNPSSLLDEGLNWRNGARVAQARPGIFWNQGWGHPYDPSTNPDGSRDPFSPPDGRFLRKPAQLVAPDPHAGTSDEARRQTWHALSAGAHGIGIFAQGYISDTILRDVWEPIAQELIYYQDLRWNGKLLSARIPPSGLASNGYVRLPNREFPGMGDLFYVGYEFDNPCPATIDATLPACLPLRLALLERREAVPVDPLDPNSVAHGMGELVLLILNPSGLSRNVTIHFNTYFNPAVNTNLRIIPYKYRARNITTTPVAPSGDVVIPIGPHEVQIWHLEDL
ncbi:MAG: hypothetical protein ABI743_06840, partial [bacterium]